MGYGAAAFLASLVSGVLVAMAGVHSWQVHLPLAVVLGAVLVRSVPRRAFESSRGAAGAGVVVLVLASVSAVSSGLLHSELVLAGRDGGTYANTSVFLLEGSDLFPDAVEPPFASVGGLDFQSPGFVPRDDGRFWQQFLHAPSALLATIGELGGTQAMYWVNPLIGGFSLVAVYALARGFSRPWTAVAAVFILGVSLPFLYFTRSTFSEASSLALGICGMWTAVNAFRHEGGSAFGAGLLLGGTALVRVDGWTSGLAIALLVVWAHVDGDVEARRKAEHLWRGFLLVAALGLFDIVAFSRPYVFILGNQFIALVCTAILVRVLAPAAMPLAARRPQWLTRSRLSSFSSGAILVLAIFAWVVRPLIVEASASFPYGLETLQVREGLPVEPSRTYAEFSMQWLTWYLGVPLVALALATVTASIRTAVARTRDWGVRAALLSFLVPAAIYLTRPSINPDHIWAMRRFLPVVVPGVIIAALAGLDAVLGRVKGGPARLARPVAVVTLAIVTVSAAIPLWDQTEGAGSDEWMRAVCVELDGRPVLLVNDDPEVPLSWVLGPPLRAWCGVSVAGVEPDRIEAVAEEVGIDEGLAIVRAADEPRLDGAQVLPVLETSFWQSTLMERPAVSAPATLELLVALREPTAAD